MERELCELSSRQCKPCEGGTPPIPRVEAERLLAGLPGWELGEGALHKRFDFKNYSQTIFFVNAVAWIAQRQGHHPDLEVSYNSCPVTYTTHAIGGLSENDFICAARVDALFL